MKIYPFIFFGLVSVANMKQTQNIRAPSAAKLHPHHFIAVAFMPNGENRWQVVYLLHFMLLCLHRNVAAKNQKIASRTSGNSR